jgi:hypothetical protein
MRKLEELLAPKADAVGYRLGWAAEAAERIREAVPPTLIDVELAALDVEQLLTCPGLWTGTKLDVPFPSCAGELRRQLFHDVCVHYLAAATIWGTIHPLEFARDYLAADAHFGALQATWLCLMSDDDRRGLASELASCLTRLVSSWPGLLDSSAATIGPVRDSLAIGGVRLLASHVDTTVGAHRRGPDAVWPGSVLVRFVAGEPTMKNVEEMSLGALVHTITTGCPPLRIVLYDLLADDGFGVDVERDWLETAIGMVRASLGRLVQVRLHGVVEVQPGTHCVTCPLKSECDFGSTDEDKW